MTQLQQSPKIPQQNLEQLKDGTDLEVGAVYIRGTEVFRVLGWKWDGRKKEPSNYDIIIELEEAEDWECTKWRKRTMNLQDWDRYDYGKNRLLKSFQEYREESLKVITGEISPEAYADKQSDGLSEERAIIGRASKEALIAVEQQLQQKKQHAEMVKAFISYEMERRKRDLEAIKNNLGVVLADFYKKIDKIQKVIVAIELYLGINEELVEIKQGEAAPSSTPISFRQQVLYMDEEVGEWKDGGLDFEDIDWFDGWLVQDDNFKKLLPEEKGVLVFRPRRNDKEYNDHIENAVKNQWNKMTYLLIRNGEKLFRVYTPNIAIYPRLFPKRAELEKLLNELKETEDKWGKDSSSWEREQEQVDKVMYQYRKRALLLQGLIDRTEVFHPLPAPNISILNMDRNPDAVRFIYDDEATLPSGRLPFWDWVAEINAKIKPGSRVLLTGRYSRSGRYVSPKDYSDRIYFYCNEYNLPPLPQSGIYTVERRPVKEIEWVRESNLEEKKKYWEKNEIEYVILSKDEKRFRMGSVWDQDDKPYETGYQVSTKEIHLTILHNPGDTVYQGEGWGDYDPHERKRRIAFRIYPDDHFVLNYDQIDLEDVEFYLNSRVDRQNYLTMMPLLRTIKQQRIEELAKEQQFVRFVVGRNYRAMAPLTDNDIEGRVWECVAWWKFKNQYKRPIDKDDELALRMIERRLLSPNYHKFEKYQ